MAFRRNLVVAGATQYDRAYYGQNQPEGGIALYRIERRRPYLRQLSALRCQIGGEVAIVGELVIAGVVRDHLRPARGCNRNGLALFDISDVNRPRRAGFVELPCGVAEFALMHTRTKVYAWAPGTCDSDVETPSNQGLYREMSIVRIFPDRPLASRVVSHPEGSCQEVFVFQPRDLAGCVIDARLSLFDISDPENPLEIEGSLTPLPGAVIVGRGTFTWDGGHVVLASARHCAETDPGRPSLYIYNVEDPARPESVGTWAVPGYPNATRSVCPVRGMNFLPFKNGRDLLAAGIGHHGVSLIDLTDPAAPREVGNFNTEPLSEIWAAYWYNGRVYATSVNDGGVLRALRLGGLDRSLFHNFRGAYNPQTQTGAFR